MEEIEAIQLTIESELYNLSREQLTELAENLEIPLSKYVEKSRMVVIKAIRDQLNELLDALETTEEKKLKAIAVKNFIDNKPPPLEDTPAQDIKPEVKPPQDEKKDIKPDVKPPQDDKKPGEIDPKPLNIDVSKVFRRDFKIKGQIGSPGAENQLPFISLARQIESAVGKG